MQNEIKPTCSQIEPNIRKLRNSEKLKISVWMEETFAEHF